MPNKNEQFDRCIGYSRHTCQRAGPPVGLNGPGRGSHFSQRAPSGLTFISGQSERLYSDCGLTVSERRAKLLPTTNKKGLYK